MWQQSLNDFYTIMAAGEPPLAIRFLALNTVAMVVFIIRRLRGAKPMRMEGVYSVQFILIVLNCAIALSEQYFPTIRIAVL